MHLAPNKNTIRVLLIIYPLLRFSNNRVWPEKEHEQLAFSIWLKEFIRENYFLIFVQRFRVSWASTLVLVPGKCQIGSRAIERVVWNILACTSLLKPTFTLTLCFSWIFVVFNMLWSAERFPPTSIKWHELFKTLFYAYLSFWLMSERTIWFCFG